MKNGFTLVELSIVLVAVGLMIGGILIGQSLIDAAKTQKFVSEIRQIRIMMQQFSSKARCVAGDCAKDFIPTNARGDGDGIISYFAEAPQLFQTLKTFEIYKTGEDLSTCGDYNWRSANKKCFMKGALGSGVYYVRGITHCGANECDLGYGPGISYIGGSTAIGQNWMLYGGDLLIGSNLESTMPGPIIESVNAAALDGKMDDGMPNTGKMMGLNGNGTDGYADDWCVADKNAATPYSITLANSACIMAFYLGAGLNSYVD